MESLGPQRSVYLRLPMLADAVADCENDCRSTMTGAAAGSPLSHRWDTPRKYPGAPLCRTLSLTSLTMRRR
jgi:hypothetical protein